NKVQWNSESNTSVGTLLTSGLENVINQFSKFLDKSKNSKYLIKLFNDAYLEHKTLTEATRYLVNELFGEYGLVIIDGDDKLLKKQFAPFVENELVNQTSFKQVSNTIEQLKNEYKIQVNPREINLFYLTDKLRSRVIFEGGIYKVVDTDLSWTK
ncbi:MAG TPA: bacillithiol biosynthesis cysteine-adding enzyme BshC, partial [Flavobacteriaceae bacterium]|nr:bacillithiol biosynthesis cysteine-adding enzyme BshC [Flavobacteriaceae bacterium]